jgi:RNase P subunit RPR2
MKQQRIDIDLDKHYNATVVIACEECGHETRMHLKSLAPDAVLACQCGADISLSPIAIQKAEQKATAIKESYRIH